MRMVPPVFATHAVNTFAVLEGIAPTATPPPATADASSAPATTPAVPRRRATHAWTATTIDAAPTVPSP
jgi:hypothetical protein